jgi:hypothetical protein
MAHMDRIRMGDMYGVHGAYDYKRARARSRPRFTSSGDTETLCVSKAQKEAIGASVRATFSRLQWLSQDKLRI